MSHAFVQGAGRGIGLGFVQQLLARQQVELVFAAGRNTESSTELLKLQQDYGNRLRLLNLDLCNPDSIAIAAETVAAHCDRLHLLVNCAGVLHEGKLQPEKRLEDVRAEHLLYSFQVNACGPLLLAQSFLDLLGHDERAVFATISARVGSISDNRLGGWYAYRGSKAAQNMFTKTLSLECRRRARKLICVALHPGTTDTGLSKPFQANVPPGKLFSVDYTVGRLLEVIDGLQTEHSGGFFAYDGQTIPW